MKDNKGIALLIVLWILTILSVIALSFVYMMRLEIKMAKYQRDKAQAFYLARAGLERAIVQLVIDKRSSRKIDALNESWSVNPDAYEDVNLAGGSYKVEVSDESGKININTASAGLLRNLPVIKDAENRAEICDSIIDWRDTNSNHELSGSEDNYYQALEEPYHCKNGHLDTVEELLLVKGVTGDLLYEEDADSDTSFLDGDGDGVSNIRLKDIITVYTDGKVNINTAGLEVLSSLIGGNAELARNIIKYRAGADGVDGTEDDSPFSSAGKVTSIVGGSGHGQFAKLIKVNSNVFKIVSVGRVDNSRVTKKIEAIVDRSNSPLKIIYYREN
ncbi:MAG: general secretion pathway protein GspK [Candidatus Aureabacteria bacterium]|nr:general secretion pathway protein GspK [Candidatus Auribacterota bacterium]